MVQALIELEREKDTGRTLPLHADLVQLLGRPGITLAQYLRDATPSLI
jgi:hypothetical protein